MARPTPASTPAPPCAARSALDAAAAARWEHLVLEPRHAPRKVLVLLVQDAEVAPERLLGNLERPPELCAHRAGPELEHLGQLLLGHEPLSHLAAQRVDLGAKLAAEL